MCHSGIENENEAAEIVIRAERGMGAELARMAETGERQGQRDGASTGVPGQHTLATREQLDAMGRRLVTLESLGLNHNQSSAWQRLARIPDDQFDLIIRRQRR